MKKTKCFLGLILIAAFFYAKPFAFAEDNNEASVKITPSVLFVSAIGDREKFEEDNWSSRNFSGGISSMSLLKQLNHQDSLEFEGRAIGGNNDYLAELNLAREGVGSLVLAFKEFRKYYDGTGGFYSPLVATASAPLTYGELESDLHLDIGNFKVEGILAKEGSLEYIFEYEREFKEGKKSLISWGEVNAPSGIDPKIYPTFLALHEAVDKFKIGVKHQGKDSEASAQQSWERARTETSKINSQTYNLNNGTTTSIRSKFENVDSDLYTTVLRYAKDLNKKCSFSFGVLYDHYIGGSIEQITDSSTSSFNENHPPNPARVEQDTVTVMPNISLSPLKDLLMGAGLKAEYINRNGSATYNRDYTNGVLFVPDGTIDEFVNIKTELDQRIFSGNVGLKYSGFKKAVFYGDGEFERKFIDQFEVQNSFGPNPSISSVFGRDTRTQAQKNNFAFGCKFYPASKLNVTAEYKNKNGYIDNNNEILFGDVTGGLRGFIDTLKFTTYTPRLNLKYKPFRWVAYNLGYTFDKTIYSLRTRASDAVTVNNYIAHMYSAEVTLTPADYFYLTAFYQRRNAVTETRANGSGGNNTDQQPNYKADFDVIRLNYGYAATKSTTIDGGYSMYRAANFNDFSSTGLPLGLDNFSQDIFIGFKRALTKDRSVEVKYTYQMYDEDSNNNIDDYEAHLLYAAMNMAF